MFEDSKEVIKAIEHVRHWTEVLEFDIFRSDITTHEKEKHVHADMIMLDDFTHRAHQELSKYLKYQNKKEGE